MPNKFLDILDDIKHLPWYLTRDRQVRTTGNVCPVCAYVNQKLGTTDFVTNAHEAMKRLDATYDEATLDRFLLAADYPTYFLNHNTEVFQDVIDIRTEMFSRLGLAQSEV
jgi:hypothetical protein